jgi:hypothetical protein
VPGLHTLRPIVEVLERRRLLSETSFVSGHVFDDLNGDTQQGPDEPPLAGVRVFLDEFNSGFFGRGDPVAHTNHLGDYVLKIVGVRDQTLPVVQIPPSRVRQSHPPNSPARVTLGDYGAGINGVDFGDAPLPPAGTIVGNVKSGGVGVANWTVFLDVNHNGVFDKNVSGGFQNPQFYTEPNAVTDDLGNYTINDVAPGTYDLRDIVTAGWHQKSPPVPGQSSKDSTGGIGLKSIKVVAWRTTHASFHVSPVTVGRLVISVFNDRNGDGRLDFGETLGLGNDAVEFWTTGPGNFLNIQDTSDGFVLDNLAPGGYSTGLAGPPARDFNETTSAENSIGVVAGRTVKVLVGVQRID